MISRSNIGPDGMVAVWHKERAEWVRRWPVDARELIAFGHGSLEAPAKAPPPPVAKPQPKPTLHAESGKD